MGQYGYAHEGKEITMKERVIYTFIVGGMIAGVTALISGIRIMSQIKGEVPWTNGAIIFLLGWIVLLLSVGLLK